MNGIEAEEIVLGMCLIDPSLHGQLEGIVGPQDFVNQKNRAVFELARTRKLDAVGIAEHVNNGSLKGWGVEEIARLIDFVAIPTVFDSACRTLQSRTTRRNALQLAGSVMAALNEGDDIDIVRMHAEDLISAIRGRAKERGLTHISTIVDDVIADFYSDRNRFITSGFKAIDRIITGFFNKDFIILAARPSVGKTALAASIAYSVASRGYPVAFFSLEMSDRAIVERALSTHSGLNLEKIRSGMVYEVEKPRLDKASERVSSLPIFIDDRGGISIERMHAEAKEWKRKHNGKMIIVDYLQLAKGSGSNGNERVSKISAALKDMAKDLDMPVIALSQLNRSLKDRANKQPELSDLRDSGALEQDADLIMFLHREDYYAGERLPQAPVELIVAKQRGGQVGVANMFFDGASQSFK